MKFLLPLVVLVLVLTAYSAKTQSLYFPPLTGNTWDTLSPTALGWCTDEIDPMLDFLESKNTKAFIVLKDGKIVIEKYFGTFTQDSLWYWASAGKTLTAFLVGMAQQEGYLSIADTSSKYLGAGWTNCGPAAESKITVRHQLTMTSGLDDGVPDSYCTLDTCLNCLSDPGTRWAYHNAPYTLLDGVIEGATGKTLNTYFNQKLKNSTGMTGIFLPSGYNNVFYSRARTMARFGLLVLNGGNWNGNQVMTDTAYFSDMVNTSNPLNKAYGYLWWLNGKESFMVPGLQFVFPGPLHPHAPDDMISALGKNGQIINIVPSQNIVVVRIGNVPGVGDVPATFSDSIWVRLNEVICTTPAKDLQQTDRLLTVFPNPSDGICTVALPEQYFDLEVLDAMGRTIMRQNNNFHQVHFQTNAFPQGIFTIRVKRPNGGFAWRKLVVVH